MYNTRTFSLWHRLLLMTRSALMVKSGLMMSSSCRSGERRLLMSGRCRSRAKTGVGVDALRVRDGDGALGARDDVDTCYRSHMRTGVSVAPRARDGVGGARDSIDTMRARVRNRGQLHKHPCAKVRMAQNFFKITLNRCSILTGGQRFRRWWKW
jgi:hypothetical protein